MNTYCRNKVCYCSGNCVTVSSSSLGHRGSSTATNPFPPQPTVTVPWRDNTGTWPYPYAPSTPPYTWPSTTPSPSITYTLPNTDGKTVYIILSNPTLTPEFIDVLNKCKFIAGDSGKLIVGIPSEAKDSIDDVMFFNCEKVFTQLKMIDGVTLHNEYTIESENPDIIVMSRFSNYNFVPTEAEVEHIESRGIIILQFVQPPVNFVVAKETATISNTPKEMLLG